jgi:Cof subfamily protein (haloacid dehalogenase superfamily)
MRLPGGRSATAWPAPGPRIPPFMPVRLIASDLDGTLLRDDGSVSGRTRAVLARAAEQGIPIVLVTGRPPRWVRDLPALTGAHAVVVCANGALLYDVDAHTIIDHAPIPSALAVELVDALRAEAAGCAFACEMAFQFGHDASYPARFPPPDVQVGDVREMVAATAATKLIVRDDHVEHDTLVALVRQVVSGRAEVTHSGYGIVEISAPGVDKARGLRVACERHGIDPAEAIAFGDMPNDIPMLVLAGHGVAVANAHADVRAIANEITVSNEEDGVAVVLERFLAWPGVARR